MNIIISKQVIISKHDQMYTCLLLQVQRLISIISSQYLLPSQRKRPPLQNITIMPHIGVEVEFLKIAEIKKKTAMKTRAAIMTSYLLNHDSCVQFGRGFCRLVCYEQKPLLVPWDLFPFGRDLHSKNMCQNKKILRSEK